MANPEHVALVRKGEEAIAEWRRAHSFERLDLNEANLSEANLGWTNLSRANLSRANLSGANLHRANLNEANLSGANLRRADLSRANLSRANLSGASLTEARLIEANLSGANLSGANLSQAHLGSTSLGDLDLNEATGLADVQHFAPSTVGVDTLIASFRGAGNKLTPELITFFRGAGVPEELLMEVPRIVVEAEYYSCFISYGQPDLEFAQKLTEDLRTRGVRCWLYHTDKKVGADTHQEIEQKLQEYNRMVVLCSIHSLLQDGIRREIDRQLVKDRKKLVPISLEDGWKHNNYEVRCLGRDLKPFLLDKNYADFANKPYDEALEELLRGLRRPAVKRARRKRS